MKKLDLSEDAIADCHDTVIEKVITGSCTDLVTLLENCNNAFIFGMKFAEWHKEMNLHPRIYIQMRHAYDTVKERKSELDFWSKKYQEAYKDTDFLGFVAYVLDSLFTKNLKTQIDLAVHFGKKYAEMKGLNFDYSLQNLLVIVRTKEGLIYLGVVQDRSYNTVLLKGAYFLGSSSDAALDRVLSLCEAISMQYPCMVLYGISEIIPCTPNMVQDNFTRLNIQYGVTQTPEVNS